jgi:hypothetical protein
MVTMTIKMKAAKTLQLETAPLPQQSVPVVMTMRKKD